MYPTHIPGYGKHHCHDHDEPVHAAPLNLSTDADQGGVEETSSAGGDPDRACVLCTADQGHCLRNECALPGSDYICADPTVDGVGRGSPKKNAAFCLFGFSDVLSEEVV